jgi:hypothetical protein
MTSNQRRPGFRLPWSTEAEAAAAEAAAAEAAANGTAPTDAEGTTAAPASTREESELGVPAATTGAPATPRPAPAVTGPPAPAKPSTVAGTVPAPAQPTESSAGFMRDLVAAMRRVAEETRQAGLSELRTTSEERVRTLEADSERRRGELRSRAEADIAAVGEWETTEAARIKQEAEQRVVARRAQLDQQLAAETSRAETDAKALRDRVAEYERELDAYHAQLSDIADPAAFAAAAKRMPAPPRLSGPPPAPAEPTETTASAPAPAPAADQGDSQAAKERPAEGEALTARLAELDATIDAGTPAPETKPAADAPHGESAATEVLVKGLGSFGAITGFRQALASVEGIDGVSLSLGPTGEFVFRAIHPAGFDVAAAITTLEGDAATVEERPEGGLRVTLDRAR